LAPLGEREEPTSANAINNTGQVVGNSFPRSNVHSAFITDPSGNLRDLGSLGGSDSAAYEINDAGQAVGMSGTAEGNPHPFITGPDGMGIRDLGTLGEGPYGSHRAYGINESGQVVGYSAVSDKVEHTFITGLGGVGMRDIGTLPGGSFSGGYGINSAGQVVGYSDETVGGGYHAFIAGPDGVGMKDLNSLVDLPSGVILTSADDINNRGQVIALASVIPEPEPYPMLLAGLGLIGFITGRKKRDARSAQ
jgi:probable HAF family extracellular repeat protein